MRRVRLREAGSEIDAVIKRLENSAVRITSIELEINPDSDNQNPGEGIVPPSGWPKQ